MHIRNTPNVGDRYYGPYQYFNFPKFKALDLASEPIPNDITDRDCLIFGGGAIEPLIGEKIASIPKGNRPLLVGWGIGASKGGLLSRNIKSWTNSLDILGVREKGREWGQRQTYYVPCASCMHPAFDIDYELKRKTAFYTHATHPLRLHGMTPENVLDNRSNFEEVIRFLGESETVVTNSYHGTYWGLLLNKRVVCIPFSSKFYGYPFEPSYCLDSDWVSARKKAVRYSGALDYCRELNRKFYEFVLWKYYDRVPLSLDSMKFKLNYRLGLIKEFFGAPKY